MLNKNNMIPISLILIEEVESVSIWIPIVKAYRYETIPTDDQKIKLTNTLETCRSLFNTALGHRVDAWENGKWNIKYKDQQDQLPELRNKNDEFGKRLKDVYTDVLQNQLHRVDLGFDRFFKRDKKNKENPKKYKKPGHPRFKGKNRMKSFTFPRLGYGCHILNEKGEKDEKGDIIRLSGIGDIKFIKHTEIGDPGIPFQIKTVTMKKEVDKWIFIPVIETFTEIEIPIEIYKKLDLKPLTNLIYDLLENRNKNKIHDKIKSQLEDLLTKISKGTSKDVRSEINTIEDLKKELDILNQKYVGNDMGLPNLMTDSNGKKTEAPGYLNKSLKRLRKEQQKLAKKQKYDVFEVEKKIERKIDEKTEKEIEIEIEVTKKDKNGKEIVKRDPKTGKKIWKGSNNRNKQVEKVAKVHRYIANQRLDYNHVISKGKVKDNELNVCEKLDIQKMMNNRRFSRRIADAGWGQTQRFMTYKAEESAAEHAAGKRVDFVDPVYTSQSCSDCGMFVGKVQGEIFRCPSCGLTINVHENAARNIRNRSPIYQQKLDGIYQRLSSDMKEKIRLSEMKIKDKIYLWSLDPEDSFTNDDKMRINRDAATRIYAFGEVTYIQLETVEQVVSWKKEAAPDEGADVSKESSIQAAP